MKRPVIVISKATNTETTTTRAECYEDAECYAEKPYCINEKCVECKSADDCDANQYCADSNERQKTASPYQCQDLNFSSYDINGITYYFPNDFLSWWDGDAFCKGLSKKLGKTVTMITASELTNDWDTHNYKTKTRSELAKQLYNLSRRDWVWASDSYLDSSDESWSAYAITLRFDKITRESRSHTNLAIYTICR